MKTYDEACQYINSVPKFAPFAGIENMRTLLKALKNPEKECRCVHIAGTNGKGSVARMMALMFQKEGLKTGLFISPHLVRINERILIDGEEISDGEFAESFSEVIGTVEELLDGERNTVKTTALAEILPANPKEKFTHPTYFDILFVMAALYFAKMKCDVVVWETGLGGRLDATNTVTPMVSVITSVGLDHMQYLGNTVREIAGEKAGIIKPGIPVVYNTGSSEADEVILAKAKETGSRAIPAMEEYKLFPENLKSALEAFASSTPASYQRDNAITAATAFLQCNDVRTNDNSAGIIEASLREFYWPGRMEMIAPGVVIDGAHNEDAAKRFVESIRGMMQSGRWKKLSLFFAVSEDKDYETIIRILCENLDLEDVYVGEIHSSRRTDSSTVTALFQKYRPAGEYWNNYASADMEALWNLALKEKDEDTLLAAVGSLYLVGELKMIAGSTTT